MILRMSPIIFAAVALTCFGQERFSSGELKGFVKSGTEHIIVHVEEPFVVSAVAGVIASKTDSRPLANVIFEVRGPGNKETVRAAKTDHQGRFKIKRLLPGRYVFKATLDGFQSVVGMIVVSKTANQSTDIRIELPIGV